jgi:hypothetical protein
LVVGSVDPYAGQRWIIFPLIMVVFTFDLGVFFSKDRREEVIEMDESPETIFDNTLKRNLTLISQGEFMKGCPESGEQGFLFSLYLHLSSGTCACPYGCGEAVVRKKRDFFTLFVSLV